MEIEELLKLSVARSASDLHLLPGLPPYLRINGDLTEVKDHPPLTPSDTERLIYSIMSEEQLQRFQNQLGLDMAVMHPDLGNFRVSALHQLNGIAAVFRVIPEKVPSFDQLDLPRFSNDC